VAGVFRSRVSHTGCALDKSLNKLTMPGWGLGFVVAVLLGLSGVRTGPGARGTLTLASGWEEW
jgi:hypothetical protein